MYFDILQAIYRHEVGMVSLKPASSAKQPVVPWPWETITARTGTSYSTKFLSQVTVEVIRNSGVFLWIKWSPGHEKNRQYVRGCQVEHPGPSPTVRICCLSLVFPSEGLTSIQELEIGFWLIGWLKTSTNCFPSDFSLGVYFSFLFCGAHDSAAWFYPSKNMK